MRRSTAVGLVLLGASGLGAATYGLHPIPRPAGEQTDRCDGQRDAAGCIRRNDGGFSASIGIAAERGGPADRARTAGAGREGEVGRAPAAGGADVGLSHGVARGGFGEAGAAYGAGGGE